MGTLKRLILTRTSLSTKFFFLFANFLFRVLNPNGPRELSNLSLFSLVPRLSSSFRERFFKRFHIHRVKEKFSALKRTTEEETLRTSSPLSFRTTTLLLLLLEREEEEEKKGRK